MQLMLHVNMAPHKKKYSLVVKKDKFSSKLNILSIENNNG